MLPASLTSRRVSLPDGTTAYPYPWDGAVVPVMDSALNVLEVVSLFADERADEGEKAVAIISRMFADADAAYALCDWDDGRFKDLIEAVCRDVFGIDTTGEWRDEPLWDPEEDAALVRASFRMAYGVDWDAQRGSLSWAEFLHLVGCLPYETPLGRAMYYRDARNRPAPNEYNAEQVAEFDRLHDLLALTNERSSHDRVEAQAHRMDDAALALGKLVG